MERGTTYEARVNVKRPFKIDIGGDDQPNMDRYLTPALKAQFDERVKADYARQRLRAGPHPSRYFRFNSHTPYQVFKEILHEHGYDALIVDGSGIATGGKQLVVFDPTNVTIVGTERFENEPYEPDLL